MATDSLRDVGGIIRRGNRQADLAIKRVANKIPKKERARDTISSVFGFTMTVHSEGSENDRYLLDVDFNKPPPDDCAAGCIATTCQDFPNIPTGGHSFSLLNPYEAGTVRVFSNGLPLDQSQWYEENPLGGQVYVQVQLSAELIIVCYAYVIC